MSLFDGLRCDLCGKRGESPNLVFGRPCLACGGFHRACCRCIADFQLAEAAADYPVVLLSAEDRFTRCLLPLVEPFRVARELMGGPPDFSALVAEFTPYIRFVRPRRTHA